MGILTIMLTLRPAPSNSDGAGQWPGSEFFKTHGQFKYAVQVRLTALELLCTVSLPRGAGSRAPQGQGLGPGNGVGEGGASSPSLTWCLFTDNSVEKAIVHLRRGGGPCPSLCLLIGEAWEGLGVRTYLEAVEARSPRPRGHRSRAAGSQCWPDQPGSAGRSPYCPPPSIRAAAHRPPPWA